MTTLPFDGNIQKVSLQLSELTLAVPDAIDSSETTESRRTYVKVARSAVSSARRPQSRDKVSAPSSVGRRQNKAVPGMLNQRKYWINRAMATRSSITASVVRRQECVRARTHLCLLCLDLLPDVPCSSRCSIRLLHVKS
ncbi:hypothetical protein HPB47_002399 [Ixodes persulcatus]|uniref:Uncharacterized protein n=1 Tax=Ixodes persulcatus TaxID=34615 RepID=A0AC60PLP2_IXOPE|nr:hypothetical protein HPB47_002399 [Ixodes persulcatus]